MTGSHALLVQRLGASAPAYFAALKLIAEAHARLLLPEIAWRIEGRDGTPVPAGKSIDVIVKEMR